MLALMDRATTLWRIPVVGRAKGRVIRRLIERRRPTRAIEIGSLLGYSAILIAGTLPPRGRLTCLEANPYHAKGVKSTAEGAGLGFRVQFARHRAGARGKCPAPSALLFTNFAR